MKKKISKLDRAEALIRIPAYKKDIEKLIQFRAKVNMRQYQKKEREILRKYALNTLLTADLIESLKNPKVTAIHKKTGKIIPHAVLKEKAPKIIEREREKRINQAALFVNKPWIVTIKVDLNLPVAESKFLASGDIEALYLAMEEFREKSKERDREFSYEPWEIYDMYHIDGKSLGKIAKEKSGINENPTYNKRGMAAYKAVQRSYKYAKRIIEQVRAEIERQPTSTPSSINVEEIVKEVRAALSKSN